MSKKSKWWKILIWKKSSQIRKVLKLKTNSKNEYIFEPTAALRWRLSLVVEELHYRRRFGILRVNVFHFLLFHETRNYFLCADAAVFWIYGPDHVDFCHFYRNYRFLRILCLHQQNLWANQNRLKSRSKLCLINVASDSPFSASLSEIFLWGFIFIRPRDDLDLLRMTFIRLPMVWLN